jgi:hypothetical protein
MFMPLAFVAGQHGFALLAPYLAACLLISATVRHLRAAG